MINDRETLFKKLEEIAEIAIAIGEINTAIVLHTLCGSMLLKNDTELAQRCQEFSKKQMDMIQNHKAQQN